MLIFNICPYGKEVNTSPSHGEVSGSIPLKGTKFSNKKTCCFLLLIFNY